MDGIKNQAWDIFYVSQWSAFYYKNAENDVYALATDDNTLKMHLLKILHYMRCLIF